MSRFVIDTERELSRAVTKPPPIHSHHEGYALLLEALDDYWHEVTMPPAVRDEGEMYDLLVHIATVAGRIVRDLGLERPRDSGVSLPWKSLKVSWGLERPRDSEQGDDTRRSL